MNILSQFLFAAEEVRLKTILDPVRLFEVWTNTRNAPAGDIAEVGVYMGGTLKLMAKLQPSRTVWGFDTFAGMPLATADKDVDLAREFNDSPIEIVQEYLADCPNVRLVKGLFPDTATIIPKETKFGLVHLDADYYAPTLAGLEFFWPRMVSGGMILLDDFGFPRCPGVQQAALDYFRERPDYKATRLIPPSACVIKP